MYDEMVEDEQVRPSETQNSSTGPTQTPATQIEKEPEAANPKVIVLVLVASFIELIAAGRNCDRTNYCSNTYAFAVAVGCVSFFVSFVYAAYVFLSNRNAKNVNVLFTRIVCGFLFVWWCFGAGFNTFRHPFSSTGNGYFASWLAFGASAYLAYNFVPLVRNLINRFKERSQSASRGEIVVLVVFVASVVELIEAITLCDESLAVCSGQLKWSLSIGVMSTSFTGILLLPFLSKFTVQLKFPLSILTALLWLPGAGVLTFDSPFTQPGNGYFATWIAFFGSTYWAYHEIAAKFGDEIKEKLKNPKKKVDDSSAVDV